LVTAFSSECRRYAALGAVLVAGLACKPKPTFVLVSRVVIDAPRAYDERAAAREAIRSAVADRLSKDSSAAVQPGERNATHVLHLRIVDPESQLEGDTPSRKRMVSVRLRPLGSAPAFEATGMAPGDDPVQAVLDAFDDAWRVIGHERELDVASDDDLIAALGDADPRIRDFVIVRLGDRKLKASVDALCKLLDGEPKSELILRAIGSLVAIGDARAVDPLIKLSERKDPEMVLQIVYAVGAIGGRTAEGYLVTMASGHPVEAVRKGAEQALDEMKRPR
jgi:hypothetical protein